MSENKSGLASSDLAYVSQLAERRRLKMCYCGADGESGFCPEHDYEAKFRQREEERERKLRFKTKQRMAIDLAAQSQRTVIVIRRTEGHLGASVYAN